MEQLRAKLLALDGAGYKAYKALQGQYRFPDFLLSIDHVQGDPFAHPSRISIQVNKDIAALPEELYSNPIRRIALEDFLGRAIKSAISRYVKGDRGSGCSGDIDIVISGQQVLIRNAVLLLDNGQAGVEARLTLGLPANDRRAAAQEAISMFFEELPKVVNATLRFENLDSDQVLQHVQSVEDQDALRHALAEQGLVAFVANGSILPRASGVDDRPMPEGALPFEAPPSLAYTFTLPNAGKVCGLAIPQGITLIIGGGFHGKSTLLKTLELAVYNHIPGDGRERVATLENAAKIRAEDGRGIWHVDISPFINQLPFARDTTDFSTCDASGSTSQAANIIEALECGSQCLLMDEDTSASNFMIRDECMQTLVGKDKEPITPFIHRARDLYAQQGVSSIIVMGGSGDYFDIADTVIMMDNYEPRDVTTEAKRLAKPQAETDCRSRPCFNTQGTRKPGKAMLDPRRGNRPVKIDTRGKHHLLYGEHQIDLSHLEQLIDTGQTRSIGLLIHYYAQHHAEHHDSLANGLATALADARQHGLDIFSEHKVGNLALPRLHELAAAINRIRVAQQGESSIKNHHT